MNFSGVSTPLPLSRRLPGALAALLLLLLPGAAAARRQEEPVERVDTNLVRLNVGVADRQGRPVTSLTSGDFAVFEDGVKQNIVSFEPAAAPFSLVLLLDLSGSTLPFRQTLRQAAIRFLSALGPEDRLSIIAFHEGKVRTLTKFSIDRKKAVEAITYRTEGGGSTNLYQGLSYALEQLAAEGQRRKAVVVLTDGVDTDQRREDGQATAEAASAEAAIASLKPSESTSLRRILDRADRQGITVYPLALPSGDPKRLLPLTPQQAAIYVAARARMQALAERTGGRIHEIARLEDMGRLYAEVAAEMRTLYSIAYQAPGGRDGRWRAIQIEVARPDLVARTRPGYFAR